MNASVSRRLLAALIVATVLPLAGCDRGGGGSPPLAGAAIGGPFQLVDQNGHAVTERSYAGRYRTMYFGYTYCPDVCPTDLQKMMQGYRQFAQSEPERAAELVPIFVTVDPARDTPAVMKQYVSAFGPQLVGLTGSEGQIAAAAKTYGIFYRKEEPQPGAQGYLMDHSRQTMLFGPDGKPIALIPTDDSADAVAKSLAQWVR